MQKRIGRFEGPGLINYARQKWSSSKRWGIPSALICALWRIPRDLTSVSAIVTNKDRYSISMWSHVIINNLSVSYVTFCHWCFGTLDESWFSCAFMLKEVNNINFDSASSCIILFQLYIDKLFRKSLLTNLYKVITDHDANLFIVKLRSPSLAVCPARSNLENHSN